MVIDLRSDTVTQPSTGMLDAMCKAQVGDDVFGDDPSINKLQAIMAERFGMEAALFCPSGTMTNQIAIRVHTQPGDEVICDQLAHIYNYEGGGIAANAGCSVKLLQGDAGRFTADMVASAINADDPHYPRTRLVSIENTSNKGGGAVWSDERIQEIRKLCTEKGLALHLDGARFYNAVVNGATSEAFAGKTFDSISICLSKGLGCPVGSVLLGSKAFIHQAKRVRKLMGGGMRQAGFLAAAGIYALENNISLLKTDHEHAKLLGETLKHCSWVASVLPVETNIVVAILKKEYDQTEILNELKANGLLAVGFGPGKVRFVLHNNITFEMVEEATKIINRLT
jgi:threonine aldolase